MKKILKYSDFTGMVNTFCEALLNPSLNESLLTKEDVLTILNKFQSDLKFNVGLITTFGTGLSYMIPVVNNIIKNTKSCLTIDTSPENMCLLALTAISILYLEEKKSGNVSKEDVKNLLTELKLRGIGNGIVKKLVNCLKSISKLVYQLFKNTPNVVNNLIDMFSYTALFLPTMNALMSVTSQYDWNLDNIVGNLASLGTGLVTILGKNGIKVLINKLKNKWGLEVNPDIDTTGEESKELDNVEDINMGNNKLIREQ